jgi:hypothetical protein
MMCQFPAISLAVAALAVGATADPSARAGSPHSPTPAAPSAMATCIALPLPSLRGAEGSATDVATALRELVSTYLTGPSLRTVALDARLLEQAIEESQQKGCGRLLTITLTRKRSNGGGFGRALGEAAGAAAWHMPYGASATANVARSAAIAGSSAVSSMASNTRAKDELLLEYRLMSESKTVMRDGKDSAKAKADGEDLLTPLVERMADAVAAIKD